MDEMLGRPEVDPHGDPIPDAEGVVKKQQAQTLLTCPVGTRMTVARIIDQDKQFLRFVENNDLKPGETVEVEERDEAADRVRLRGKHDRRITIGTRAASKLLVHVARSLLLITALASPARALGTPAFEISDSIPYAATSTTRGSSVSVAPVVREDSAATLSGLGSLSCEFPFSRQPRIGRRHPPATGNLRQSRHPGTPPDVVRNR
jgi:hypothetical protein